MSAFPMARRSRSLSTVLGTVAVVATSALALAACAPTDDGDAAGPAEHLTLKIGTILPQTGSLSLFGPPEIAGTEYAASQIDEADAGITVELFHGDSGDTDNKAYETEVPRILSENPAAIIGAASSGTSLQFIDQVTGAGVIQFSPANTSAAFTDYDDGGLYFRTAPSDVLQGEVLGNLIAEDGNATLGIIAVNDSYGTGLSQFVKETFEASGGTVVVETSFNVGDTSFDAQVSEVLAAAPDAIALITFDQVSTILPALFGNFPKDRLYFVDGSLTSFGDAFPAGSLTGAKGTLPGLSLDTITDFTSALNDFWVAEGNETIDDLHYAAEAYDAVNLLALAALAAKSTDSAEIAAKLQEVSGGSGDGEKCTTFADCAAIINDGKVADYDGISGPITFDEVGDPTEATIGIYQYGDDNLYIPYED